MRKTDDVELASGLLEFLEERTLVIRGAVSICNMDDYLGIGENLLHCIVTSIAHSHIARIAFRAGLVPIDPAGIPYHAVIGLVTHLDPCGNATDILEGFQEFFRIGRDSLGDLGDGSGKTCPGSRGSLPAGGRENITVLEIEHHGETLVESPLSHAYHVRLPAPTFGVIRIDPNPQPYGVHSKVVKYAEDIVGTVAVCKNKPLGLHLGDPADIRSAREVDRDHRFRLGCRRGNITIPMASL